MNDEAIDLKQALTSLLAAPVVPPHGLFSKVLEASAFRGRRRLWMNYSHQKSCAMSFVELRQEEAVAEHQGLVRDLVLRHGWLIGTLGWLPLIESAWLHCSPETKGEILAGLSNQEFLEWKKTTTVDDWFLSRLKEARLTPLAACELAVNGLYRNRPALTAHVLAQPHLLVAGIQRKELDDAAENCRAEDACPRGIDLVLEAALCLGLNGWVRRALVCGADPNSGIFWPDRPVREKFCALSFAARAGTIEAVRILLKAGADADGTNYSGKGHPLFQALAHGRRQVANELIWGGASFQVQTRRQTFFGRFEIHPERMQEAMEGLVPLVPVDSKEHFHVGGDHGGMGHTWLTCLLRGGDSRGQFEHFTMMGMSPAIAVEELCAAIDQDCFAGLEFLLRKNNASPKAWFRIRRMKPHLGTERRENYAEPSASRVPAMPEFVPMHPSPLELQDGSRIYVNLGSIAPAIHSHGPVAAGHVYVQEARGEFRRRGETIFMSRLHQAWRQVAVPGDEAGLEEILPCVREFGGPFYWMGINLNRLRWKAWTRADRVLLERWQNSAGYQSILAAARKRIDEQNRGHGA